MRILAALVGFALFAALAACTEEDDDASALGLGPGGLPCDLERGADGVTRVVCPDGDFAVVAGEDERDTLALADGRAR